MKILYGIQTTGNGHITRSLRIIEELKNKNIDVDILTSGNFSQINLPFDIKYNFRGLSFKYKNGKINYSKTLKSTKFKQFLKDIKLDLKNYDKIITDFEPITAWSARSQEIDSIGIGNQYSFLSTEIPRPKIKSIISETILKKFALVDTYCGLHFEEYDKNIFKPIIKKSILESKTSNNGKILIYLPAYKPESIIKIIENFKNKNWCIFSVYNSTYNDFITIKKVNNDEFNKELISCEGIITSSGFQTPSEALILHKKLFCIPIKGQYEQLCNSIALSKMGILCGELSFKNIKNWIENYNYINYNYEDPIDKIINFII